MAEIYFSLGDLFQEAFGYKSQAFQPNVKNIKGDKDVTRTNAGKHGSPYYAKDIVGREYYLPIEVQVGSDLIPGTNTSYARAFGVTNSSGAYDGRWNLPYPVMSADVMVHVVDTALTERDGLVSELINLSGYKIKIKGLLINKLANEFPEDDYNTLVKLVSLKTPVRINSVKTDILMLNMGNRDKTVTIRNLKFPEAKGMKHVQPYELEMITELPFNLIDIS